MPASADTIAALNDALTRLATGQSTRTDGRLTVTNLATEAGLARSTVHRAPEVVAALRLLAAHRRAAATRRSAGGMRAQLASVEVPDPGPVTESTGAPAGPAGPEALRITATANPVGFHVDGDIDANTIGRLRATLTRAVRAHDGDLIVDLTGVSFIDIDGLRLFVDIAATLSRDGYRLVLDNLVAHLSHVMSLVGWDRSPGLVIEPGARM